MVDPNHPRISIVRQCRLVSIARSSFYYAGTGESPLTLRLMRLIDEQFLETPFYGSRQMTRWLRRQGDMVSRKRVRRLMRLLGVHALYQRPVTASSPRRSAQRSSLRHPGHCLAAQPLIDEPGQEIGERRNVLPYACLFQSSHVGVPPFQRHD